MAVAFDAASTNDTRATNATTLSHTLLTVGVGSNRVLVVTLFFGNWAVSAPTGVTVTWDSGGTNQACSLITSVNSSSGKGNVQLWGLIAPTSGNKTLSISWTNAADANVAGIAYSGANQVNPFGNSNTSTGNSGGSSVGVLTSANDAVVGAHMIVSTVQSINSTNFTTVYIDNINPNFGTSINHEENNASATMTSTFTGSDFWAAAATNISSPGEVFASTGTPFGIIGSFDTEW